MRSHPVTLRVPPLLEKEGSFQPTTTLIQPQQYLVFLHLIRRFHGHLFDHGIGRCLYNILHFHGFQHQQGLTAFDQVAFEQDHRVGGQAAQEEPGLALQRTSPTVSGVYVRGLTGSNWVR